MVTSFNLWSSSSATCFHDPRSRIFTVDKEWTGTARKRPVIGSKWTRASDGELLKSLLRGAHGHDCTCFLEDSDHKRTVPSQLLDAWNNFTMRTNNRKFMNIDINMTSYQIFWFWIKRYTKNRSSVTFKNSFLIAPFGRVIFDSDSHITKICKNINNKKKSKHYCNSSFIVNFYPDPAAILEPSLLIEIWVIFAVKRDTIPSGWLSVTEYICRACISVPTYTFPFWK